MPNYSNRKWYIYTYLVIICWENFSFIIHWWNGCSSHRLLNQEPNTHIIYHNLKYRSTIHTMDEWVSVCASYVTISVFVCICLQMEWKRWRGEMKKKTTKITSIHFRSRSRAVNCLRRIFSRSFALAPCLSTLYSCISRECIIYNWFTHWFSYANRQWNRYHHISTIWECIGSQRVTQSVGLWCSL